MRLANVAAYIVPSSDPHLSEYVPAPRVAHLVLGPGTAVVTLNAGASLRQRP